MYCLCAVMGLYNYLTLHCTITGLSGYLPACSHRVIDGVVTVVTVVECPSVK